MVNFWFLYTFWYFNPHEPHAKYQVLAHQEHMRTSKIMQTMCRPVASLQKEILGVLYVLCCLHPIKSFYAKFNSVGNREPFKPNLALEQQLGLQHLLKQESRLSYIL